MRIREIMVVSKEPIREDLWIKHITDCENPYYSIQLYANGQCVDIMESRINDSLKNYYKKSEIDTKITAINTKINSAESDIVALNTFKDTTVPSTYQTIANETSTITKSSTAFDAYYPTVGAVKNYIDSEIAGIIGPMKFIGTVSDGKYPTKTSGEIETGSTYKVITMNSISGVEPTFKIGDMLIKKDSGWEVIPSGDDISNELLNVSLITAKNAGPYNQNEFKIQNVSKDVTFFSTSDNINNSTSILGIKNIASNIDEYIKCYWDKKEATEANKITWSFSDNFVNQLKTKLNIQSSVQSDWNQTDTSANDYIKNKPTIPKKVSDLSDAGDYVKKTDLNVIEFTKIVETDFSYSEEGENEVIMDIPKSSYNYDKCMFLELTVFMTGYAHLNEQYNIILKKASSDVYTDIKTFTYTDPLYNKTETSVEAKTFNFIYRGYKSMLFSDSLRLYIKHPENTNTGQKILISLKMHQFTAYNDED